MQHAKASYHNHLCACYSCQCTFDTPSLHCTLCLGLSRSFLASPPPTPCFVLVPPLSWASFRLLSVTTTFLFASTNPSIHSISFFIFFFYFWLPKTKEPSCANSRTGIVQNAPSTLIPLLFFYFSSLFFFAPLRATCSCRSLYYICSPLPFDLRLSWIYTTQNTTRTLFFSFYSFVEKPSLSFRHPHHASIRRQTNTRIDRLGKETTTPFKKKPTSTRSRQTIRLVSYPYRCTNSAIKAHRGKKHQIMAATGEFGKKSR